MTDVAGANLILFKDGLIATLLAAFLYLTIRQIFDKDLGDAFYEISTVLIVATIFSFRSGMLAVIACLALLSCAVDRRNALRHIRIACFGILMALSISSTYDMLSDLNRAVDRVEDKVMFGASAHLDVQNLRYTRSRESSVLNRLNLHEFNWSNFYYAPLVKGVLYILLPLPSKGCIKIDDCLNKTSSMVYGSFLIFFLYGAWTIVRRRVPRELYILAFFLICMAAVQGAGPMIYPRYRTVFAGTFALIAVIGMSRMTPASGWKLLVVSAAGMVTLVAGYDMFYRLVQ